MPEIKLTKRAIDSIKAPQRGCGDAFYWDKDIECFGLRVKALPSGAKSYIIQYRHEGVSRRLTLGRHGTITPDKARHLAKIKLGDVAEGRDPAQERVDGREAPTMKRLAHDYLERHATPHKRQASVRDDAAMLTKKILPRLGAKRVNAVTRHDIEALHRWLQPTPYRANRVLALLSKMLSLAVVWRWRSDNPAKGILKFPEEKRERWLSTDEIRRLRRVLDGHANKRAARAVTLMLVTGARKSEVLRATWSQFDLRHGYWTKPAHFTKQKKLHGGPLSSDAVDILQEMRKETKITEPHIFPGEKAGQPLKEIKKFWSDVCQKADLPGVRLHDLRHTFASHLVSSGESLHTVGRMLGHTQSQTTARYSHLADEPLRGALKRVHRRLGGKPIV